MTSEGTDFSDRDKQRFWALVDTSGDCWNWRGTKGNSEGYGQFFVHGQRARAHRVVWEMTHGAIPPEMVVCHTCDNPSCVNPNHLFLGTQLDNIRDRHLKGRSAGPKGEKNRTAKLTEEMVREIRGLHAQGLGHRKLARQFSMSRTGIAHIVRRESWRHVV